MILTTNSLSVSNVDLLSGETLTHVKHLSISSLLSIQVFTFSKCFCHSITNLLVSALPHFSVCSHFSYFAFVLHLIMSFVFFHQCFYIHFTLYILSFNFCHSANSPVECNIQYLITNYSTLSTLLCR